MARASYLTLLKEQLTLRIELIQLKHSAVECVMRLLGTCERRRSTMQDC
jgi:hypothetical protein